jgi:hypothetical protein
MNIIVFIVLFDCLIDGVEKKYFPKIINELKKKIH